MVLAQVKVVDAVETCVSCHGELNEKVTHSTSNTLQLFLQLSCQLVLPLDFSPLTGHDSTIGRSCIICSHASLGNSSSLGDNVILGYGAAVKDHVRVAAKTRVAAKGGVVRDINEAGDYAGHPAVLAKDFMQQV